MNKNGANAVINYLLMVQVCERIEIYTQEKDAGSDTGRTDNFKMEELGYYPPGFAKVYSRNDEH